MIASWRRLGRLLGTARAPLAWAGALGAAQSALLAPVALLVRDIFDERIPAEDTGGIILDGVLIAVLVVGSSAVGLLGRRVAVRRTKAATGALRKDLLARLYGLPKSWHDTHEPGRLQAVLVNDTERFDVLTTNLATGVVPALLVAATLGVAAVVLDPVLSGVLLLAVPLAVLAARVTGRRARDLYRAWHGDHAELVAQVRVGLRAMTLTKVHGAEELELRRRGAHVDRTTRSAEALALAQATQGALLIAVAAVIGAAVLVVGAILVTEGDRTVGDLLAFYALAGLLLRQLTQALNGLSTTSIVEESLIRLEELRAETAPALYEGKRAVAFSGALTLEDVTFAYDRVPVLHDVDLAIAPGEHVALVGPNGSGKSTLVSLVLGLHRPQSGRLLADGVPYDELDIGGLRRRVGVVLQDPVILPGSIRENIAYGVPDASDEAVARAAAFADVEAFVARLPDGYATQVGDEGLRLSGGQRQRVAIARALMGDPALLVLDEPTTHLDAEGIAALLDGLARLEGGPTVLVVTHDVAAASRAGRVVHLRDGRIASVEQRPGLPVA